MEQTALLHWKTSTLLPIVLVWGEAVGAEVSGALWPNLAAKGQFSHVDISPEGALYLGFHFGQEIHPSLVNPLQAYVIAYIRVCIVEKSAFHTEALENTMSQ